MRLNIRIGTMAKKKTAKSAVEKLSIEDAMIELQEIVDVLESGQEPLDESLSKYERGMALLRTCHLQLDSAAQRIEIVTGAADDGSVVTRPFDAAATADSAVPPSRLRKSAEDELEEKNDLLF